MLEIIGWIGAILFAICGVPQARRSFKDGHSSGVSLTFLLLWLGGEILTLVYTIPKGLLPLIFNYSINIICILIILWFYFFPKKFID